MTCLSFTMSAALMLTSASVAIASPCTEEIARLDAHLSALPTVSAQSTPSEPESSAARLHHQPTQESVAAAENRVGIVSAAVLGAIKLLETARTAERFGDQKACEQAIAEARQLLGP
jgi:hypothetical protein